VVHLESLETDSVVGIAMELVGLEEAGAPHELENCRQQNQLAGSVKSRTRVENQFAEAVESPEDAVERTQFAAQGFDLALAQSPAEIGD
jgi:hypothetical protein